MSYDGKIMRQALARFEEDKQRRAAEFTRRRDRLYETEPRLKEIEQQLRATMPKLIASALRRGAKLPINYIYSSIQSVLAGFAPDFFGARCWPSSTCSTVCQPCWCQRRRIPFR